MSPPTVSDVKPLSACESSEVKEQERVQYVMHPFRGDAASAVDDMAASRDSLITQNKEPTEECSEKPASLPRSRPARFCNEDLMNEEMTKSQPKPNPLPFNASSSESHHQRSQDNVKTENIICLERKQPVGTTAAHDRIVNPEPTDVLFGRGKPYQGHSGNQKLRDIVDKYKDAYMSSRRYDKLAIAEDIVKGIQGGRWGEAGRFLRRSDNGEDFWVVAPDDEAREKVSHALRGKKKSYTAAGPGQHNSSEKEKKDDTGISPMEDYRKPTVNQQLREGMAQHQAALEDRFPSTELRLSERGSNLDFANDHQRMLLLARNIENNARPSGAAAASVGVPSPFELQSLLLSSRHPNRQQQLLHQQFLSQDAMTSSLFGRDERNAVLDLSLITNSNRLLAAQLGLLNADHRLTAPSSSVQQLQQTSLGQQQLNLPVDIFARGRTAIGDGTMVTRTTEVSPLISALLGQRVGSDGTREQQHSAPGSAMNIADVMRDLQQARDQRALAEFILRSRGDSGSFGGDPNHQS